MKTLQQSKLLGSWFGNLKLIAQNANMYVQFAILGFSSISAYSVIRQWCIDAFGYNLPFIVFIIIVGLLIFLLAVFEWRLGIPSTFVAWNEQWWEHRNHLRPKIEKIESDLKAIKEHLGVK